MWDRLRTTSSFPTAVATTMTSSDQLVPGRHPGGPGKARVHKQRIAQMRRGRLEHAQHHDDFGQHPLNALGISNLDAPNRYEIRRGKVVPQVQRIDIALPSHSDNDALQSDFGPIQQTSQLRQQQPRQLNNSDWRPASSVYGPSDDEASQLTPKYKLASSQSHGGQTASAPISPPSSPEVSADRDVLVGGDVSPIDEDSDSYLQQALKDSRLAQRPMSPQRQTGIPVPVQATLPHKESQPDGRPWIRQVKTGREPAPHPIDVPSLGDGPRSGSAMGLTTVISSPDSGRTSNPSPSFGQRMRNMARGAPESVDSRPPWNGASGRSTTVQPIRDDFNVAPLAIPRKSSRRMGRGGKQPLASGGVSETSSTGIAGSTMRKLLPLGTKSRSRKPALNAQMPPDQNMQAAQRAYPSPPHTDLETTHWKSETLRTAPAGHNRALSSHPPDVTLASMNSIKRKPPPQSTQQSPAFVNSTVEAPGGNVDRKTPGSSPAVKKTDDTWVQPPSRFSITTYATSHSGTPRQSVDEEQPPLPALPDSVMDRNRPVTGRNREAEIENPVVISMTSPYTPVDRSQRRPSGSDVHMSRPLTDNSVMSPRDRRDSTLSISKPLPPAPPELSSTASDRVSHLNAQIHGLVHRRVNIEKSIKAMTELMPQDRLLASDQVIRKREEEKQKVENLREELAEIQSEEHDLGLKLYRAYKRQEKESEFEPSSLWVKRVAGV